MTSMGPAGSRPVRANPGPTSAGSQMYWKLEQNTQLGKRKSDLYQRCGMPQLKHKRSLPKTSARDLETDSRCGCHQNAAEKAKLKAMATLRRLCGSLLPLVLARLGLNTSLQLSDVQVEHAQSVTADV